MVFTTSLLLTSRPETTRQLLPFSGPQSANEATCLKNAPRVHALSAAVSVCLACCVLADAARAQQPSDAFVKWAAARAIPLRTVQADGDARDLAPFKSVVGAACVVALGEPAHGTHEPLALRN
jgi:hypothetical protein